jgi:hypothetical protein
MMDIIVINGKEMTRREYCAFMHNPENLHNCAECPENREFDGGASRCWPCGQQNCWVHMHTR